MRDSERSEWAGTMVVNRVSWRLMPDLGMAEIFTASEVVALDTAQYLIDDVLDGAYEIQGLDKSPFGSTLEAVYVAAFEALDNIGVMAQAAGLDYV